MEEKEFVEFMEYLIGPEGCNYNPNGGSWRCDFALSVKLLKKYFPKVDTGEFIERCRELGAFCDCEILLNIEAI